MLQHLLSSLASCCCHRSSSWVSPPLLLLGSRHLLFLWNKGFPWKLLQWFPPALK